MPANRMGRFAIFIGTWNTTGRLETESAVRFAGHFDTTHRRLQGLWELKGRRSGWQPWIELELVRA